MKYWKGYLTAAIFAALTGIMVGFGKTHAELIDMVYPYVTRMGQDVLTEWSGSVGFCVWQALALALLAGLVVTVVLMIIFRWNPIQWFGWVLAVAAGLFCIHTGMYGLNNYASSLSEDLKIEEKEYTVSELKDTTEYLRDKANELSGKIPRDSEGRPDYSPFEELAQQAGYGFDNLVYEDFYPVFAGSRQPVKKLAWGKMYSSMGITGVTMPLTGEAAVNPQIPAVSLPFTMCHEMCHRLCISVEQDANFGGFLACIRNPNPQFQYSGYLMAYQYCVNALYRAAGSVAVQDMAAGEDPNVTRDLAEYDKFFSDRENKKATKAATKVNDTYIKASGDDRGVASYGDVTDILVNWYLKEFVIVPDDNKEPSFNPLDKNQVDVSDIIGVPAPAPEG